jgi:very-short-patch-repair endonuclease
MAHPQRAQAGNPQILRARALRRQMSPPEAMLWQVLRTRPDDLKFRRQHPFSRCTVDFYCASARLAVEVDGDGHDMGNGPEWDARRDAGLERQGVRVIRFLARDVAKDLGSVVRAILLGARR